MKLQSAISAIIIFGGLLSAPPAPAGTFHLDYSTYFGGTTADRGYALAVNEDREAYLAGSTASTDFPTVDSYQVASAGGEDVFLAAFSAAGSSIRFSTYLGGSGADRAYGLALADDGSAYLCGVTSSADFPTLNPYQGALTGGKDVFISRFDSSGALISASYLGGSGDETGMAIAVAEGGVYVTGSTTSADFPTANAYQPAQPSVSRAAFLSRFDSSVSGMVFSTYLGGNKVDGANDLAVAPDGSIYLTGYTESGNFPLLNSYQGALGGGFDAFLTRFSSPGQPLISSTYLGGQNADLAGGMVLGGDGSIYLAGNTFSEDFPTVNPFQAARAGGSYDAFLTRFSSSGETLISSTYLGGSKLDYVGGDRGNEWAGKGIARDDLGRIYLSGHTESSDFPTRNQLQASLSGDRSAFLTVFQESGSELFFSTYLGGTGVDTAIASVVDGQRWAYLAGFTTSDDFPTANPVQPARAGGEDAFLSRLKWITPSPSMTPTPSITPSPSITPTPSPTPSITPTPSVTPTPKLGFHHPPLYIRSLEDVAIHTLRATQDNGWAYYFQVETPGENWDGEGSPDLGGPRWGYIWDRENQFHSETDYSAPYQLRVAIPPGNEDWKIQAGDYLTLTYDGGQVLRIYLPEVIGTGSARIFYPDSLGNTYVNYKLTEKSRCGFAPTPIGLPWSYDYDGDGISDVGVFQREQGLWAIRGVTRAYFGSSDDIPVPGGYAGDGTTRIGLFRPASGLWAVKGVTRTYFGSGSDIPVPGDYKGHGTDRVGIFRPDSGLWAVKGVTRTYFGSGNDIPVPGYYGDGEVQSIGIYRPESGLWAVREITRAYFGNLIDVPVPGDYKGSGSWSPAIFRPGSGLWAAKGVTRAYFGSFSDDPRPGNYGGAACDQIAIYRPATGLWGVRGETRIYFGSRDAIPVSR